MEAGLSSTQRVTSVVHCTFIVLYVVYILSLRVSAFKLFLSPMLFRFFPTEHVNGTHVIVEDKFRVSADL